MTCQQPIARQGAKPSPPTAERIYPKKSFLPDGRKDIFMAKKLMFMISTYGKTKEQIVKETLEAIQKYQSVKKKIAETRQNQKISEFEIVLMPTYKKPKKS